MLLLGEKYINISSNTASTIQLFFYKHFCIVLKVMISPLDPFVALLDPLIKFYGL